MSISLQLAALLVNFSLLAQLPPFDQEKLPYRGSWGRYTVVVESIPTKDAPGDRYPQRARILDSRGRVVREIRDRGIHVCEVEMTGKGPPELCISGYSGGAHCCTTDYYFTRDGGAVKNILIFLGGNDSYTEEKDLNGDGRKELLVTDDGLSYLLQAYGFSPRLPRVIGWNGKRYVDMTHRYPARALADMKQNQQALRNDRIPPYQHSDAQGYYADALVLGREKQALTWLRRNAPRSTTNWLVSYIPEIRRAVSAFPRKIVVSQWKTLGRWRN
jgi:hypothetical protein